MALSGYGLGWSFVAFSGYGLGWSCVAHTELGWFLQAVVLAVVRCCAMLRRIVRGCVVLYDIVCCGLVFSHENGT